MKILSFLTLLAALVAVVSAFNFLLGASLLFTFGLGAIAIADYRRATRVLRLPATMAVGARVERFGLAA